MLPIAKPFITVKIWRETKALIDMHAAQLGESFAEYVYIAIIARMESAGVTEILQRLAQEQTHAQKVKK